MVKLTKKDLAIIAAGVGTADFLLEGKLSAPVARALKRYVLPRAAKAPPRLAVTAFRVGKTIALRHPVLTAGAIVYFSYKNRKELGRLVEQGYDVLQDTRDQLPEAGSGAPQVRMAATPAKKKSRFNTGVSKALKSIKASTAFGKKGTINNAKKAFSAATKAVSARAKGQKAPKSLAGKVAYKAAKTVYTDEILRRKMK